MFIEFIVSLGLSYDLYTELGPDRLISFVGLISVMSFEIEWVSCKSTSISDELRSTILKKAALYQKTDKKKK